MRLSNEILKTSFHTQGIPAVALADRVDVLVRQHEGSSFIDRATIASAIAFESLLLGYNPRDVAQTVFKNCQEVSLDICCAEEGYGAKAIQSAGASAEIAVHGLLWWGFKRIHVLVDMQESQL